MLSIDLGKCSDAELKDMLFKHRKVLKAIVEIVNKNKEWAKENHRKPLKVVGDIDQLFLELDRSMAKYRGIARGEREIEHIADRNDTLWVHLWEENGEDGHFLPRPGLKTLDVYEGP